MALFPQQQDFVVFLKSTKTSCQCIPYSQLVAQQHAILQNLSLKFFKITVARLHPLSEIVQISSRKLTSLHKFIRNLCLIWCQCSLHQHTSTCCTTSYQFQNFYLHQFPYRKKFIKLLEFTITICIFCFNKKFYKQLHIYMEHFESLAIPTSQASIKWCFRYVGDVHNATRKNSSQQTSSAPQFHRLAHQIHHRTPRNRWTPLPWYPDQTHS